MQEEDYITMEAGEEPFSAAEYKGRKVTLNKPFRTPNERKKFGVYVQNASGNVVIVRFGDPNMEIKRDDPERRKAFRDRHNCAEKKDKTTPGYWSCRMWTKTPVNKITSEEPCEDECCNDVQYIFIDTQITEAVAIVQASGNSVIRISGIAFHEGYNKNKWAISLAGAEKLIKQMVGADLTLNHPPVQDFGVGFTRNMDGGVEDAVVGIITEANIKYFDDDKYEVHYVAEVRRTELFPALESGLWTRGDYGVSIGGYGIPTATAADGSMTFESDFTFDHLAIVHKPAYDRADINVVEKVEAQKEFIYHSPANENYPKGVIAMSEENENMSAELEAIKAELVLANATINENVAREAAIAEKARTELVQKASDLGLNGHEDLSAHTITSLIASWEASRPAPVEKVLAEATPAPDNMVSEIIASSESKEVVANYLNGEMVETDAKLYARVWNSLVASYNSGNFSLNGDGQAYTFEEAQAKGFLKTNRGE
jgi:hypothetical protein